jgi:protein ImuB
MQQLTSLDEDGLGWDSLKPGMAPRPLRLLVRPEPIEVMAEVPEGPPRIFRWRRVRHRIIRAEGPERLAPEWWLGPMEGTRDYYRVEDDAGSRFWLYRKGLYATAGTPAPDDEAPPSWYMHGLFA